MRRLLGLVAVVLIGSGLVGCREVGPTYRVHLSGAPGATSGPSGTDGRAAPLRIAAASIVSPQETVRTYGKLFAYLGSQVGRPIELVQRKTYQETLDLLQFEHLDVALVCTQVYVLGHDQMGLALLAAPAVNGRAEYHSLILVRSDSGVSRIEDLKGKRFAYTDPLSTSGRLYPLALLREHGEDPRAFFASATYTYSHDSSIKAVVQGLVDGAAVDSLVYGMWARRNPDLSANLRVIHRSSPFPSPPVVVGPQVDPELRERLREALLTMHQGPEGRRILAELGIDRFVPQSDDQYAFVRQVSASAGVSP